LVCGDTVSRSFAINDCVWEDSIWKTINFLFCERCGCEVPGKHYLCHADVTIRHGDLSIVANGGWHDAGDMTQTTTNTAECTYALFELLANIKNNKPLHDRVLEEAKWGLEWILKTRFGDGYRVPTSSKSCWTNNIMGDKDDIYREAAYETIENFMCAGTEALASKYLRTHDPVLSTHCAKVAKEDWNFAWNHRFEEDFCKLDDPNRIYTFLLKYSAAAWSALDVFQATNDEYFKEKAVFCAQEIMQCQQQELTDWDVPFTGFFYDDKSHKLIAHCSHRCHDNEPIQALSRLAQAFPEHENFPDWMYAINLYGDYIQKASRFTAPYNVMPSSIYHEDEAYHAQDYDMGMIKKYLTDDECRENYKLQVRQGISLGKGYYLRRMPVAFEHRGNHAVTLAGGKAVSQAAIAKNDFDLMELANRQFEWIVGKNPFAESVMFGEGYDYCQEYAVLPGEMAGELGVGFACLDEHDSPFWPQVNTCVYKEVWIRPPLLWTWLAADLHGPAFVSGIAKPGSKVTFTEKSTRVAYVIQASPNTGWYQGELPSSEYQVSCDNSSREITLLSSRTYRMDTPFYDFRITAKKTGTSVEFEIQTSGEGLATISLRSSNLDLKPEIRTVKLGEAIAVRAELNDPKKPYYLVLAPKDNPRDIWEAFGY
ncbi:MAG: glycoside hydrolase family 9 protein, partial [Clostridiales bacterium]|nr:glycoside hydrolase family 9 protein [Clostridiales bacterium]